MQVIKGYKFVFDVIKAVIIMLAQNYREEIQGVLEMIKYESVLVMTTGVFLWKESQRQILANLHKHFQRP